MYLEKSNNTLYVGDGDSLAANLKVFCIVAFAFLQLNLKVFVWLPLPAHRIKEFNRHWMFAFSIHPHDFFRSRGRALQTENPLVLNRSSILHFSPGYYWIRDQ